ncbi:uncharacterized protein LOC121979593 [Zingiber officinale]|uniref:uncharacterized protein LOC121979593 n=1 Tax=Zingiber officinale TaxID=94328 RepID=UPI001C4BD560|nr:uncharacterized protein LOC121979593 [Zingiber officinale]
MIIIFVHIRPPPPLDGQAASQCPSPPSASHYRWSSLTHAHPPVHQRRVVSSFDLQADGDGEHHHRCHQCTPPPPVRTAASCNHSRRFLRPPRPPLVHAAVASVHRRLLQPSLPPVRAAASCDNHRRFLQPPPLSPVQVTAANARRHLLRPSPSPPVVVASNGRCRPYYLSTLAFEPRWCSVDELK